MTSRSPIRKRALLHLALQRWWGRLAAFLSPFEDDRWLTILRAGLGMQVAFYCASLRPDWNYLFARSGQAVITRQLSEAMVAAESWFIPNLGWLISGAGRVGLDEQTALFLTWAILLAAGCCLAAGAFCRAAAMVAWFLHLCTAKSGGLVAYGVDNFMTMGLFYLMLTPLPDRYALDARLWKRRSPDPRNLGFFRRVLQVHLCLVYFFSGLTKSLGNGWWDGSNIWRALTRPPFNILPPEAIAAFEYVLPFAGISICLIELGYPVLIWLPRTPQGLAGPGLLHASRDRIGHGNVSFRSRYDCAEPRRIRSGSASEDGITADGTVFECLVLGKSALAISSLASRAAFDTSRACKALHDRSFYCLLLWFWVLSLRLVANGINRQGIKSPHTSYRSSLSRTSQFPKRRKCASRKP